MQIYVFLVKRHMRTCDPTNTDTILVPLRFRARTIEMLAEIGLDPNGDPIVNTEEPDTDLAE